MTYDKPVWRWVDGAWLVFVPGNRVKRGTEIAVSKKGGSESCVTILRHVSTGNGGHFYQVEENARKSRVATTNLIGLNRDSRTGEFIGSEGEIYKTSLHSCTCPDFEDRGLPCKHIYRLSAELGTAVELPEKQRPLHGLIRRVLRFLCGAWVGFWMLFTVVELTSDERSATVIVFGSILIGLGIIPFFRLRKR